jgi:hypothetical protein
MRLHSALTVFLCSAGTTLLVWAFRTASLLVGRSLGPGEAISTVIGMGTMLAIGSYVLAQGVRLLREEHGGARRKPEPKREEGTKEGAKEAG